MELVFLSLRKHIHITDLVFIRRVLTLTSKNPLCRISAKMRYKYLIFTTDYKFLILKKRNLAEVFLQEIPLISEYNIAKSRR